MNNAPMKDSDGTFDKWRPAQCDCRACKGHNVEVREWESSDGGYEDYQYRCKDCGHSWWVDGIDS